VATRNGATNGHQMINSPFKWVGGKSRLRKAIIQLLPPHTCYVEPFAGAAWVLFGKPRSDVEVLNDINEELITFFRVVKSKSDELLASFEWELVSRAEFERLADQDPSTLSDVQRAHRFYYLIMAGWGGELNYPRFQTSITDGGHGNRLIGALKTLESRLKPVHDRLRTVIIECLEWEACVDRYDREGTVMYVDPPYPGNKCNYANNMRDWEAHQRLRERLVRAKCKWVLSSYDTSEVCRLYDGYYILPVESSSGMKVEKHRGERVINREVLITNFPPPNKLLLYEQNDSQQSMRLLEKAAGEPYLDGIDPTPKNRL
jgi:DNA adenine methylase